MQEAKGVVVCAIAEESNVVANGDQIPLFYVFLGDERIVIIQLSNVHLANM
jgi:hypothetical protein